MANNQHWGDTEFGYRLGIAVVILAVGLAACALFYGISRVDAIRAEKAIVTEPRVE